MSERKEISALLRLIDDPDVEVFDTVADKILNYGTEIIGDLEQLWEVTVDQSVQERIEHLIHRVHFQDLEREFFDWSNLEDPALITGTMLIAKYQFPELNMDAVLKQFEKIRRNIWLELNNYLTPLEKVNVLNSILYNYYKMEGHELTERAPKHFFINQVLDSKQGNAYGIGVLYLALCEQLDIPVFCVDVPKQLVFAYVDTMHHFYNPYDEAVQQIQFFIDPIGGMVYTQADVDAYLRKINAKDNEAYFTPLTNKQVIFKMLEELSLCYRYNRDDQKADEIQHLMHIVVSGSKDGDIEPDENLL